MAIAIRLTPLTTGWRWGSAASRCAPCRSCAATRARPPTACPPRARARHGARVTHETARDCQRDSMQFARTKPRAAAHKGRGGRGAGVRRGAADDALVGDRERGVAPRPPHRLRPRRRAPPQPATSREERQHSTEEGEGRGGGAATGGVAPGRRPRRRARGGGALWGPPRKWLQGPRAPAAARRRSRTPRDTPSPAPPPAARPLVFPRRARSRGAGRGGVPRRTSRRSRGRT